jgi:predicted  nucleic acid-binding Zn-ribbon protein
MATPAVGQDIEDICTRCGDTWHVVMAKVGERVIKVVCKLCGGQHNYRGEKNKPAASDGSASSSSTSTWGRARKRRTKDETPAPVIPAFDPSKPPRAYSPRDSYYPGERVVHANFGTGVVSSSLPGKVEVQFPTGPRTLACAKTVSNLERPVAVEVALPDRPPAKPNTGSGSS